MGLFDFLRSKNKHNTVDASISAEGATHANINPRPQPSTEPAEGIKAVGITMAHTQKGSHGDHWAVY